MLLVVNTVHVAFKCVGGGVRVGLSLKFNLMTEEKSF